MENNKIKILVHGSCWPTNIGNAFVQIGIENTLRSVFKESEIEVFRFGSMGDYLFWKEGFSANKFDITDFAEFDYVLIGGMTQCKDYFEALSKLLKKSTEKGSKVIIVGGGAEQYNEEEVEAVKSLMKEIEIFGFISRDRYSYHKYKDCAHYSYDGIDSAFYVRDNFCPIQLKIPKYNVANFDSIEEPNFINVLNNKGQDKGDVSNDKKTLKEKFFRKKINESDMKITIDMEGNFLIRTHHAPWPGIFTPEQCKSEYTMISDLPSDYLNIYSQARTVYSDRVHACIASLALGNKAMLFGKGNPRITMFERVNAGDILEKPVSVDMDFLCLEKNKQAHFLKDLIFEGLKR